MKRSLRLLLSALVLVMAFAVPVSAAIDLERPGEFRTMESSGISPLAEEGNAEFAGGTGMKDDPYLIADKYQLNNVRNHLSSYFKLTADIVFTEVDFALGGDFYNSGAGWKPISTFSGSFDGNGHTITGLYVNIKSSGTVCAGLFGYNKGLIQNVGMVDGSVSASSSYSAYAGGISGRSSGTISNCYNTGSVSADDYAGGISGDNYGGTISNCYNTGSVSSSRYAGGISGYNYSSGTISNCYNTGSVSASSSDDAYAGGISGYNGATIGNCYNTGKVNATSKSSSSSIYAGGIVGLNNNTVGNCYNVGSVTGSNGSSSLSEVYIGGIAGSAASGATNSNCYYLETAKKGVGSGTDACTKCSVAEMEAAETFSSFNFDTIWEYDIFTGYTYPQLKWQLKEITKLSFTGDSVLDVATIEGVMPALNAKAEATYADGTVATAPVSALMLPDFDVNNVVSQKVALSYRGAVSEDTINIIVIKKAPQSLTVTEKPQKLAYVKNCEELDVTGGKVTVTYNNGTTEEADMTLDMISGFHTSQKGTLPLKVTFKGVSTTYDIEIVECTSLKMSAYPMVTSYYQGQPLILTGGKLEASYSNGTTEILDLSAAKISYNKMATGTVTVTATLYEQKTTFEINVIANPIDSLEMMSLPNKTVYSEGDELDLTGGKVKIIYENGLTEELDLTRDMVSGFDTNKSGTQTLEVIYGDKTLTFDVTVNHVYQIKDVAPTCTEQGYTLHYCNCGESYKTDLIAALNHNYKSEVITATCTEIGCTKYTCTRCHDSYTENETPALGHTEVVDEGVAATCTTVGKTEGKHCSVCNEVLVKQNVVPAKGHDEVVDKAVAATCTADGLTLGKHCSVCNEVLVKQEVVYALGHDYKSVVTKPTCTKDGYTTHTCSRCDDSYTDSETEALDHNYKSKVTAPTCTEKGYTTYTCSRCEDSYTDSETEALGHNYKSKVTAPTCTKKGYTTHTCSRCDDSYKDNETKALGHTEVADKAVAATCTKDGLTAGKHCSVCNEVLEKQEVVAAKGHTEVADKAVAATCTATGLTAGKHCSVCNEVLEKQEVVAAKGHTEVVDKAVDATCTAKGLTAGKHCSVCNEVLEKQEVVAAKGHTEVVDKAVAATCTATGLTAGKHCSVCNEVLEKQEVVAAKGHTEVVDKAVAATCTATGLTAGKHCSVCGEVLVKQEVVNALGHSWDNGVVTKKATTTETGVKTYTCTRCGATYTETIAKLPITIVFDDVTNGVDWFAPYVYDLVSQGILNGKGYRADGTPYFEPLGLITRGEFSKILATASGDDLAVYNGYSKLSDTAGHWALPYINWAYEKGIVTGFPDGTFAPDASITREQMAVMICRYAEYKGISLPAVNEKAVFTDGNLITWSADAVYAMQQAGIINGYNENGGYSFKPQGNATRAEAATMISRFLNL